MFFAPYRSITPQWLSEMLKYQGRNRLALQMSAWHETLYHHAIATAVYSEVIGRELGYSGESLNCLTQGAFFHDVGKISWPTALIDKSFLDDDDMKLVKTHPITGEYYLRQHWPQAPELVCRIVKEHHERADGFGYPCGLKADEISPLSMIVAAVEVFTALLEYRPYRRKRFTQVEALAELEKQGFSGEVIEVLAENKIVAAGKVV